MMITWSACKKLNVVPVLPKARSGALNVANRPRFAFQERQGRSLHGRRLGDLFPTTLTQAQASSHEWQPKQRGNALPASEGESPVSARSPHIIPQPIPDDLSISTPRSLEDGVSSTASLQELLSELSTSSPARPASNAPSAPTATPIATPGASLDASFCRPQELVRKGIDQLAHMLRWLVFGQLEASQGELQFQVYQENRPSTSLTRFGLPLLYRNKSQSARMVSLAEFFHCRDTLDCANLLRHIGALAVHYNPYQSDRVEQLASSLVVSRHHFRHMRYLLWSQDKLMQACEQFFADAHELALLIWATENVLRAVRSHLETLLSLQGTLRTLVALMRSPTDSLPDCVRKLREMRQAVREDRQRVGLVDKSTTSPSPAPVFAAAVLRPRRGLPFTFEQLRICTSLYQGKPLQLAVSGEYFWLNDDSVVRRASYFSVPSFTADQVDLELRGFELLTCCLRRFYLTSKWREPVQQALQRESQKVTAGIEQSSARAVWKQLQDRHNSRYDEASAAQAWAVDFHRLANTFAHVLLNTPDAAPEVKALGSQLKLLIHHHNALTHQCNTCLPRRSENVRDILEELANFAVGLGDWPEARELCRLHQDWELSASVWQRERHLGTLPLADVLRETEAALDDLLTRFETRSTSHAIPARSLGMSGRSRRPPARPSAPPPPPRGHPFPVVLGLLRSSRQFARSSPLPLARAFRVAARLFPFSEQSIWLVPACAFLAPRRRNLRP
eukprot:g75067.t1